MLEAAGAPGPYVYAIDVLRVAAFSEFHQEFRRVPPVRSMSMDIRQNLM